MGFILDISVTRLREGDTIQFGIDANTYTITVINPQNQPSTLEVQGTSDVIPQENEWLVAVDRLENAISKINPVQTVESNNTVISIEFENGVNFTSFTVNDTNGSLVNGVQVVATTGVITNLGSVLVPNITVTSIDHKLIEYGLYTALNYPHGNMGDKLETVINFTSAGSFTVLDFYYGWTDNNTQLYPLASQNIYQIDQSLFTDITTGAVQKYTGNTGGINAVAPLQGNKVDSISLSSLGGNDYELTIVHYIPILPRPTDRTPDNNLNKPVEIETSLKFIFQVDLKADILEPNATESTAKQNLTPFVSSGNIGYIGEIYQTGQVLYTLDNFFWNNQDDELNSGFTTGGTITINKLSGSFDATHDVIIKIQKLTDTFNQSESQLQNYDFDSVQIKLDSVPVSSTTLQNAEGSFSGSTATINFDVAPDTITGAYALWVSVADGTANKSNQNVLLKVSNAINSADDTTVIFGTYPSSTRAEYNYNFHYLDPITNSFNQVKSYIDDFVVSRFRIENTNTGINTLNSITIRIRANNSVLETFTVTPNDFVSNVATISRAFNLVSGDIRNNITFTDNLDGTIDVVYPFQIIDSFVNSENVVQETLATYTQNTAVGDLEFTNNWISPTFELGQYNLSKNTILDPQVTLPPSNIKFYNEAGTTEVGVILSNAKTRVIATFEESNLNDFLADPAAPFTYQDNSFINNYLCAYFGVNTNNNVQSEYIRFHNLRDNELSVWESVQVGYYAELARVDIDTATLTAVLDNEKIKEVFGEDFNCLKVTARLDKIQDGALPPVQCVIIFQTDVDNLTNVSATVTTGAGSSWSYKGVIIAFGDVLNQTIGTADGTDQDVEYKADDCATLTNVVADGAEWKGTLDLSTLTDLATISLMDNRMDTLILPTNNTNPITSLDITGELITDSLISTLDLTDVNIGGSLNVGRASTSNPISSLSSLIFPLANNNVWTNFKCINTSLLTLDLSGQNSLGGVINIQNNDSLTSITTGTSAEVFTNITIAKNDLLTGNLDLSNYPNINTISGIENSLTSVTFATATTFLNGINFNNNNINSNIDFTPLGTNFGGQLRFESNAIPSVTFPSTSANINRLDFTDNQLSTIDISMLTGLNTTLQLDSNLFTAQSDFNFGTLTNTFTDFNLRDNNISGVWDFTTFANTNTIGGAINISTNNLTQVVFQTTNQSISFVTFNNNNINTNVDLTPLTNLGGQINFENNNITTVTFPSSASSVTALRFANNNFLNFSIAALLGANNNIIITLQFNDMTTATMDALIVELDGKGWINGSLNVSNQTTLQQPSIGAASYLNLLGKGWTITI